MGAAARAFWLGWEESQVNTGVKGQGEASHCSVLGPLSYTAPLHPYTPLRSWLGLLMGLRAQEGEPWPPGFPPSEGVQSRKRSSFPSLLSAAVQTRHGAGHHPELLARGGSH